MPYYQYLRYQNRSTQRRTAAGLLRLKAALAQQVPKKTSSENLLIATWNIRDFDSKAYGLRSQEAIYYIAEIIDHFDLIAVQEINQDLYGLNRVLKVLGDQYEVIYSDVTAGNSGNQERLGFIYDTRKLSFTSLAGEIVIPPIQVWEEGQEKTYQPQQQLARTPFIIGLRTNWFKFMIATVHIVYGSSKNDSPERIREIQLLSDFLADRVDGEYAHASNLILLGDFNIFKKTNQTFAEIAKNFHIPGALQHLPSNISQNRFYDQIAFRGDVPTEHIQSGIFPFYDFVYRLEDEAEYADQMPDTYHDKTEADKKTRYFKTYWRTHQMSDHYPMWVELKIDFSEAYLNNLMS